MLKSVGKLFGLRRKPPLTKTRVDRRKTRVNILDEMLEDSDEGSYRSTTSVSSGSEDRGSGEEGSGGSDSSYRPRRDSDREKGDQEEEEEEEATSSSSSSSSAASRRRAVSRGRGRKRVSSAAALEDDSSESSDSSDVGTELRRKAQQKKRLKLPDSDDEAAKRKKRETELKKAKEAAAKRKERRSKLAELARRRKTGSPRRSRRSRGTEEEEEEEEEAAAKKEDKTKDKVKAKDSEDGSSEEEANPLMDSSEEEKLSDGGSLKDFVVEEEEQKKEEEEEDTGEPKDKDFLSRLPRQFITGSQFTHFQVVVKALLINALDSSFLKSLYNGERTKRYAQEMKTSLHHFDERVVLPRLENLKQRSRWKERYKERVECYPKVRISMVNVQSKGCEACELHRNGRFSVRLSGQLYHCNTLQEDQFMPDDSQTFFVGSVCASRTEVYHTLKHFKYHLFERCRTALEVQKVAQEQDGEDESVKDTVNRVFTKLQDDGWITKQYDEFEEHLNSADFFQEEKLD